MKDHLSEQISRLTAEAQQVRASSMDRHEKKVRLDDLQGKIEALQQTRRTQHAQRVNRVSPMEQATKRH